MRKWNKYLTVLFIFSILILVFLGYKKEKSEREEIESLISKGVEFYSKDRSKDLKIDSYIMLKDIATRTNNENLLIEESIHDNDLFVRFLNNDKVPESLSSMMPKLYPPYMVDLNDDYARTEPFAGVLLKALYCDKLGYTDYDFGILHTLYNGDGSYWDTHFLLSLIFLKNNNCYDEKEINSAIKKVSVSIINKQKEDEEFTDVYAERIVMLYWAGYGNFVEKAWIEKVKENFINNPPGWKAVSFLPYPNSHTTGLAILSLIYYLEGENYQPFISLDKNPVSAILKE
ncbi:MAG: hypothetical protein QG644_56 [Patescibacteria group bacterium]|nr:hypothetical protein [Patescibacteria group bacterium]